MGYGIVLLDADETLFDFRNAEREALRKTLALFDIPCDDETTELYRELNEGLWRQLERGQISRQVLLESRFHMLFERLHAQGDSDRCNEIYLTHLAHGADLLPGAEELCRELAPHARLVLATNGVSHVQRKRLELSAICPYISEIFVSEEIGFSKPDPRFFDAVFSALQIGDRSCALMVGDSLSSDMAGANAAGIAACWFCQDPLADSGSVRIDWKIRRLSELIPIVLSELPA